MDGGYDEGYRATPCFWGTEPGSLIKELLAHEQVSGWQILDLGCGEGKNAVALASLGASVVAVDCSERAIQNGLKAFPDANVSWHVSGALEFPIKQEAYDLVIMYGLAHCLANHDEIAELIRRSIAATKSGGFNVLVSFNDRSHDLHRAHPGFRPTLASHQFFLDHYESHQLVVSTDSDLHETHPHNQIPHHHSMTRILAKIR